MKRWELYIEMLNAKKIKKDFPILRSKDRKGNSLVYLDNSATTQKPESVINSMNNYYKNENANIHRGVYKLSVNSTQKYEDAHKIVADFINADFEEVIFTKSTTESINLVAYSLIRNLKKEDEIVLSEMEHHSNMVVWQELARQKEIKIRYIKVKDFMIDLDDAKKIITEKTKIVSITHISNVLGGINPIKKIIDIAHKCGSIVLIDGAQSIPHMKIDVKALDCDFFAFSGHKMAGPTGIGVLYGKKELLEKMEPFLYGGDMIKSVTFEKSSWNDLPWKFEAGTPNIAGAVGLAESIRYLNKIGMKNISKYEEELTSYAIKELSKIKGLMIYGPKKNHIGVISFNIKGIHAHDIATILDRYNIAVRGGHHCAMPLMQKLGIDSAVRASLYFYNTKEDIDRLVHGLLKAKEVFKA